jgi:L-fucose isomerase-like protein
LSQKPVVGVMALARSTFDVAYAEETAARAFETLDALDARVVGPRGLLFGADAPPLMADLVAADPVEDTSVLWHCGLAPLSMADPAERPRAGIHSNRRLPLLGEFALRPGRVTLARLSRSRGQTRLAIGGGRMLGAPKSFSGTSGVIRFDERAGDVLDRILEEGLEHNQSFAYGDFRPELRAVAERLSLRALELC